MRLQEYKEPSKIAGVELIDLKEHYDDSGTFSEIIRLSAAGTCKGINIISDYFQSEEVQVNISTIQPGVIKAYHCHAEQNDLWFIPAGQRCIINLIDIRPVLEYAKQNDINIASQYDHMRIVMGIKPQLLLIPKGVLHGISNPSLTSPITMIYLVDKFYNPNDEFRVDWSVLKGVWEVKKG